MKRFARMIMGTAVGASVIVLGLAAGAATATGDVAEATGQVFVVQGLPGGGVDISIDGKAMDQGVAFKTVLGPYELVAGDHTVEFIDSAGTDVRSSLEVVAGTSTDVVLHLPADTDGAAVVNSYLAPLEPIAEGKARVLVAHTATVAPADVVVDGQAVFTNIANGEFAQADVPSGAHVVKLLPTGLSEPVILGPAELLLKDCSLSMIYAVGNPDDDSMAIIVRSAMLRIDGSTVPERIDTGSAGLAADVRVHPFDTSSGPFSGGVGTSTLAEVLVALGVAAMWVRRHRVRRG